MAGDGALRRRDLAIPALVVGGLTLILDARALLPGVSVWDTAEFQAIGPVLGIAHPTGFPTYTLLAWLASVVLQPFGDPALRANLLSAILAAGATGLVACTVTALTRRPVAGVVAGVALALAPVAWRIGVRADAHALHFTLVAMLLAALVAWAAAERAGDPRAGRWLVAAAFVFALSLGNHALTLLLAPGIAAFVVMVSPSLLVRRVRLVATCVAVLALTTVALYAYIPLRSAMDPPLDYADPETWERFRYLVFAEQFRGTFNDFPALPEALGTVRDELIDAFGLLVVVAALGAVVMLVRRLALFVLTSSWFLIPFVFALGYQNADITRYYLVPLMVSAVWIGIGVSAMWDAVLALWRRAAPASGTALPVERASPSMRLLPVACAALLLTPVVVAIPERFAAVDASRETWPRQWLDAAMREIPQGAVVVSWWSFSTPLWYGRYVEGSRPDIEILDDRTMLDRGLGTADDVIEQNVGRRPVVVIRHRDEIARLRDRYELVLLPGVPPWAPVWQVTRRLADGSADGPRV